MTNGNVGWVGQGTAYAVDNGALQIRRGGQLVDAQLSPSQAARVLALLSVRDAARVATKPRAGSWRNGAECRADS